MTPIARTFYRMPSHVLFFTIVPLFFFLFVLAYEPLHIADFLAAGQGQFTLNLLICSLIILGVMAFSRMLLFLLRRVLDMGWPLYIFWCIGEVITCGLFMSIPLGIGWAGFRSYFSTLALCLLYSAGILVYPLSILSLAIQLYMLVRRPTVLPLVDERTLIRFYDEQKRLKLAISSESILYIEAEENYVHIVYLDNGRARDYILRSSMRALEESLARHGLIRCHRSFFINARHVDLLRKDANGYALAQLDRDGTKPIPVSRRYYDTVIALL
jgi:hypothetical protein